MTMLMRKIDDIEQNNAEIVLDNDTVIKGYGLVVGELPVGDGDKYEDFLDFIRDDSKIVSLQDDNIKSYRILD